MSERLTSDLIADKAVIHADLPREPHVVDRCFEMPTSLYGATVALYLGFIAVLGIGFASPELMIPMAIFAIFIIAGFALPAAWTRLAPVCGQRAKSYGQLMHKGIMTNTGLCKGRDAVVQMMILPVLIMVWALTVLLIAGFVAA